MKNYKANHLSDILSDIESNISPQNRRRAINFTSANSMNVPLSKEHGLFTIWAILVTHDELCLSTIQNSIFDRSVHPTIVATRAVKQPGLLVRKHSARGEDCTGMRGLSKQHDQTHDINIEMIIYHAVFDTKQVLNQVLFLEG
jgi:hypothetical protein